ncbi:2OG-Fe(II) oxygenase [Acinetobacter nectaris]|uniref:2OG-Fe(II) oxygenase n=1 Tax=Acinetobacter nectaris TaxID=1219382 RepID=UPI001F2D42E7|nr:2OG-Fe(II) oxygenase [Acinetobacter nectaris]MCF8999702.1 2OG-Fe(II) oxygenase [Acinetobacter nectaris]MCF9028201.1 2OG-Fe(II) oxygenase [Acinetobacter nectaris]
MTTVSLPMPWDIDQIVNQLDEFGFSIIKQAYNDVFFTALNTECLSKMDKFRAAAIQDGVISKIRSDHILWINETQSLAYKHILALENLSQSLNQAFFLGIKNIEAHFACYNVGEFYALHRDNPQQKNHRVISSVFYIHKTWQESWGGQLRLQDKKMNWHMIEPTANSIVIFESNLLHEVITSKQKRLSITAWLRNDLTLW